MSAPDVQSRPTIVRDEGVVVGYSPARGNLDKLIIGPGARLRSGTVIYAGSRIGDRLETGHHVTIREQSWIGDDVSIWTNSIVDHSCRFGDRVKIHTNCYISQHTVIEDDAFIAPGVMLANDLDPGHANSAENMAGPYIEAGAQIGANTTILPCVRIGAGAIVGAGSVVTSDVPPHAIVYGNPAALGRMRSDLGDVDERIRARAAFKPLQVAFAEEVNGTP